MKHRGLTDGEIAYADRIFGEAIDYRLVRVTRGSAFAFFSATTLGNTINLQAAHFVADTVNLSDDGRLVLIHELAHVWQYQHLSNSLRGGRPLSRGFDMSISDIDAKVLSAS